MRARPMFEEMGFKYYEDSENIIYTKPYTNQRVRFRKKDKYYSCDWVGFELDISIMLHLAIDKQCRELGWIK